MTESTNNDDNNKWFVIDGSGMYSYMGVHLFCNLKIVTVRAPPLFVESYGPFYINSMYIQIYLPNLKMPVVRHIQLFNSRAN